METTNNEMPYRLPLNREQFQAALQKGHGRAPIHLARFGADGMEDIIVEACTKNVAFDAQLEGDRAPWLISLIDSARIEEAVVPRIFEAIHRGFDGMGFWDKRQICRLAYQYALRGREDARKALYAALSRCEHSADILAAEEIIELDGADGLHHVAERAGPWLADEPELPTAYFLMDFFDEKHGKGSAGKILRSAAAHSDDIASFLTGVEEEDESDAGKSDAPNSVESFRYWTAEDIIREVRDTDPRENTHRILYRRWAIKADAYEKRRIIEALFEERDPNCQSFYLHVFQDSGLPEFDGRFFGLFEKLDQGQKWLISRILCHHKHPDIEAFAVRRIRAGSMHDEECRMLTKNYRAGYWDMIKSALRLSDDADEVHDLFRDLIILYEANSLPEAREPMLLAYEHSPCSICRSDAVEVLISINSLPNWMREECKYDANRTT